MLCKDGKNSMEGSMQCCSRVYLSGCLSMFAITYVSFFNSITREEHCDRQEQWIMDAFQVLVFSAGLNCGIT